MVKKVKDHGGAPRSTPPSHGSKTPDVPEVLRKPTTKQLVGGSSWTGKLPTALLHEYCQKQGWLKPDCNVSHRADGFSVANAVLAKRNPKNSETETVSLRPTKEELDLLPRKDLAVESRNVAATWCLHRVAHRLNFSIQMPPDHRQLWNKLEILRKEDTKNGKAWLYDADPFKVVKHHAAEVVLWEKERKQREETKAKQSELVTSTEQHVAPWKNVPAVDMSKDVRRLIETGIRSLHLSSLPSVSTSDRAGLVQEIIDLGFRKAHAQEACDHANSLELALEFLLLFTPEDDLPQRFLPSKYSTGLTGSSHDVQGLQLDYAARRLHLAGYAIELCRQIMAKVQDEELASEMLQADLLNCTCKDQPCHVEQQEWLEEISSLEAIYTDSFEQSASNSEISLSLPNHKDMRLHLRPPKSGRYPTVLPTFYVSSQKSLPCYIRLSIIKALGDYAQTLRGESMVFLLLEYIDEHILSIIANPGKLLDLSGTILGQNAVAGIQKTTTTQIRKRRHKQIDWTPDSLASSAMKRARDHLNEQASHQAKLISRRKLPAHRQESRIIELLRSEQCLVISGETGSGKSTQVVQYVLDAMIDAGLGEQCQIICTQPRRISALALADRVGDERSNADQVGYAIRGDSKQGPDTKISFVTTGVLLRRLTVHGEAGLDDVSHM